MISLLQRFGFRCSLVVVAVGLGACAEDLSAVNATWAVTNDGWQKAITEAKQQNGDGEAAAKALLIAETDATGKDLKTKLDAALAAHKALVRNLEQVATESKAAVDAAAAEQKIAPVQAAIDAGLAKWGTIKPKLPKAAADVDAALSALKTHLDAETAKAAAAAADPAAKDPETAKTAGGEASFTLTFDDKGAIDEAASTAVLERLAKFLGSCEGLKVELTAGGKDAKAGQARADATKKLLEKKAAGHVAKTAGAAAEGPVIAKVVTPCG